MIDWNTLGKAILTIAGIRTTEMPHDTAPQDIDVESYREEHMRLEGIIGDSENTWEDRSFQIAAGGLTLTFTVFSFCSTQGVDFDWQIYLIWGLFAFCLLLNYTSHWYSIYANRQLQDDLAEMRKSKQPYSEEAIMKLYKTPTVVLNCMNRTVHILLVADVIYSVIYTCSHLI